jgi:hypothetical protein
LQTAAKKQGKVLGACDPKMTVTDLRRWSELLSLTVACEARRVAALEQDDEKSENVWYSVAGTFYMSVSLKRHLGGTGGMFFGGSINGEEPLRFLLRSLLCCLDDVPGKGPIAAFEALLASLPSWGRETAVR